MSIRLYSKNWGELSLTHEVSSTTSQHFFPGAEVFLFTPVQNASCYFIQQFKTQYFTIRYHCFTSPEKDWITIANDTPSITFRIGHNHSHQVFTKELGKQVFHERSYNMFYDPNPLSEYPMNVGESFIFLDLLIEKDFSSYLLQYFPQTEAFITKAHKGQPGKISPLSKVAPIHVWRWQEELLDWCFLKDKEEKDALIIGNKLIESGIQSSIPEQETIGITLTINEANRISDAAELLRSKKTLTVHQLAKSVGLSRHKLTAGFKEIYGHPLSRHQFEAKMMFALRLLDCEDVTLTKVVTTLGYRRPRTFIDDFRKRFGFEPFKEK